MNACLPEWPTSLRVIAEATRPGSRGGDTVAPAVTSSHHWVWLALALTPHLTPTSPPHGLRTALPGAPAASPQLWIYAHLASQLLAHLLTPFFSKPSLSCRDTPLPLIPSSTHSSKSLGTPPVLRLALLSL